MKIKSWDDVDYGLRSIGILQGEIAEYKGQIDSKRGAIAELEPRIEAFVREHEDELQERSKSLPHGRVWLRQATRLVARSWAKVLEKIRTAGKIYLIRFAAAPDKEKLGELDDETLKALGVQRVTEDVFGYEAS